ncbi:MAG: terpene cyclase/mutase family protein [Planctomycetes bacterium]|nr:terpene cyclase/mutase family protein [Planctomycetota bacterium]
MNRIKMTTMLALLAASLVFAACGGGNNAAAPAGGNTPAGNATADNSTACAGTDGGTDNGGNDGGFDTAAERDAVVAKAWKYLEGMYDGDDKTMDENKVGIPGGWGRNSSNIPYTAMVLDAIIGTKVWDSKNPKIAESIDWLVSVQEPGGGYSYAPADVMPQAKGVRAVYITSIVATLFAQLNKMDGPWKGKLNDPIAKARDYIKQSQVGNADGPAPDYEKSKVGFGGWAYSKEEIDDAVHGKGKPASNMSTSSFAIDALHACGVSEDDPLWADALTFLKRNQNAGEVQDEGFEAMYKGKPVKMAEKGDPNYGGSIYSEETSKAGATENEDGTVTLASYGSMTYNLLRAYLFAGLKKDSVPVKLAWGWIQRNYTLERVPGYPDAADHNRGLYYYILSMSKTLDAMGVDMLEEPERGLKHDWKQDMVKRLKGLQNGNGSWVNDNEDWQEDSPVLCTCYALGALRRAK